MGDELHSISKWVDPAGAALTGGKNDLAYDALTPKQGAAPPGYNPANNPGSKLYAAPAGGPPAAPGGGSGPTGTGATPGYAPNAFQAASAAGGSAGAGVMGAPVTPSAAPGGAGGPGGVMPFRGGVARPPATSNTQPINGDPAQARQQAIISALRTRSQAV